MNQTKNKKQYNVQENKISSWYENIPSIQAQDKQQHQENKNNEQYDSTPSIVMNQDQHKQQYNVFQKQNQDIVMNQDQQKQQYNVLQKQQENKNDHQYDNIPSIVMNQSQDQNSKWNWNKE